MQTPLITILFNTDENYNLAINKLIQTFGQIKTKSHIYNFTFSNYYEKEMGKNLKKQILIFKKQINKLDLIKIKQQTTEIEKQLATNNNRNVNLDPGYLSEKEFVLASNKPKSWKQKLDETTHAHTILTFNNNQIKQFHHTFPEFKDKEIRAFLKTQSF
jgi:hypothetical protein